MKHLLILLVLVVSLSAQDSELTNYRSGIDAVWGIGDGSDKGSAYYEEYLFYNKLLDDRKIVYIKGSTPIALSHNATNAFRGLGAGSPAPNYVLGVNGIDGLPDSGDEGVIRYKIDRDRQIYGKWAPIYAGDAASLLPAYTNPFTLDSQVYGLGDAVAVVGTTGSNGGSPSNQNTTYYRGTIGPFGDEWHTLAYADDSNEVCNALGIPDGGTGISAVEYKDRADDGKTVLLVVNPKTPCFTARVTGTGQFITTAPKAYWTPRVVAQTTYIAPGASGTVTIELRDINGNNVFYRINGGSFTNAGAATVTLTDSAFNDGINTLEYYYAGNAAYTKTRTVVKNPGYPSDAEPHGYAIFKSPTKYAQTVARASTPGTLAYAAMNTYRTNAAYGGSAHDIWFANYGLGKRRGSGNGSDQMALKNALVAKINGFSYTKAGEPRSYGQVAKEMLMDSVLQMDQIGLEQSINFNAVPNRERYYRGYYDAEPVVMQLLAYDILIADFKASQVTGGITAIEDIFIREGFARYAYEGMQLASIGSGGIDAPGMWVGAHMTTAGFIAIIMKEYSSELYGTSGVGTASATYLNCPFPDVQYTWSQVLLQAQPHTGFPNVRYGTGWVDNDDTWNSLTTPAGYVAGGYTMPEASWVDKTSYLSDTLMGIYAQLYLSLTRDLAPTLEPARLLAMIMNGANGTLIGGKVVSGPIASQTPTHAAWIYLLNDSWPAVAALNTAYTQSLDHTSPTEKYQSDDFLFTALAIPLYDPDYYGGADVIAPTLTTATIPSGGATISLSFSEPVNGSDGFTLTLSGGAVTAAYAAGGGSSNRTYDLSRIVGASETGTLNYSAGNVQDPSGNPLATITGRAITIIGAGDSTLPTIAITAPSGNVTVNSPNYTLFAGTAADNVGVTSVTWSNSTGGTGTATGTTSWSIPTITLQPGDNIISIQSRDAAGNLSLAATRTITYNPPSSGSTQTHANPRNRRLFGR